MEDETILVATYEGSHNHGPPHDHENPAVGSSSSLQLGSTKGLAAKLPFPTTADPHHSVTLDLTLSGTGQEKRRPHDFLEDHPKSECSRIEEYVSSLTKDADFTLALAAAVARSINYQPKPTEAWTLCLWGLSEGIHVSFLR